MKTSIYLRPGDAAKLAALGMSASEAVREFCAGRGEDGMPLRSPEVDIGADEWATLDSLGMTVGDVVREFCAGETAAVVAGVVMLADPGARDPSDRKPDKRPAGPHSWRRQGLRWIARAGSLDDAARLAAAAVGAKLAAPHVLLTAEEVNDV